MGWPHRATSGWLLQAQYSNCGHPCKAELFICSFARGGEWPGVLSLFICAGNEPILLGRSIPESKLEVGKQLPVHRIRIRTKKLEILMWKKGKIQNAYRKKTVTYVGLPSSLCSGGVCVIYFLRSVVLCWVFWRTAEQMAILTWEPRWITSLSLLPKLTPCRLGR